MGMYKVIYYDTSLASSKEIQAGLDKYYEEGLELVACAGNYFIFRQCAPTITLAGDVDLINAEKTATRIATRLDERAKRRGRYA